MTDNSTTSMNDAIITSAPLHYSSYNNMLCHPSDVQEQFLAFLPIPGAFCSVLGSVAILYMISHSHKDDSHGHHARRKKLSPYLRLLLAMSVYDILNSLNWSVAALLRPKATSPRLWSIGTAGTCNVVGLVHRVTNSSKLYMGMLSFYFLLTARYGVGNSYLAKRVEPWMHGISIGYPIIFCILELVLLGNYGEVTMGVGCWLTPDNCTDGDSWCTARILSCLSYGVPLIVTCFFLTINNTIIFLYAKRQMRPSRHSTSKSSTFVLLNITSSTTKPQSDAEAVDDWEDSEDNSDNSSTSTVTVPESKYVFTGKTDDGEDGTNHGGSVAQSVMTKDQARRLRLVSSQAILFVVSYVLCQVWTGITAILQNQGDTMEQQLDILVRHYPIFVLEAIFSPLQGLFNMFVFIRPKYLKYRHLHKGESRLWVVRRSIFGEQVKPTVGRRQRNVIKVPSMQPKEEKANHTIGAPNNFFDPYEQPAFISPLPSTARRLKDNMASSLTASQGDFDHVMQEVDDERWNSSDDTSKIAPLASQRKRSSLLLCTSSALDVISEHEASYFEAVPVIAGSEDLMVMDSQVINPEALDRRWNSSGSVQMEDSPEKTLHIPSRLESTLEISSKTEEDEEEEEDSLPLEHLSPSKSADARSNHPPNSRESPSSCLSLDRPMKIPRRRMSPPVTIRTISDFESSMST